MRIGNVQQPSCSLTSTARRSTASTSPTSMAWRAATRDGAALSDILNWLTDNWNQPEEGIGSARRSSSSPTGG